jgi:dTDP-4-dehydrorhamnose reductase
LDGICLLGRDNGLVCQRLDISPMDNKKGMETTKIMNKIIAVLGEGYLGTEFQRNGYTVLGKDKFEIESYYADSTIYGIMDRTLSEFDVIINCIAKSNTRFCENNYKDAYFSNAMIPKYLSHFCAVNGKKLVHISTGCLYDKNNIPQKETDFLSAHCNYTLTKWQGEKNCNPNKDLIIRPRLFFDGSDRPNNLINKVKKFDRLCNELDSITSVKTVVNAINALLRYDCVGAFNVACDGYISMHQIGKMMGLDKGIISIDEIRQSQGLYLVNNVMDISKLEQYFRPPMVIAEVYDAITRQNIDKCYNSKLIST